MSEPTPKHIMVSGSKGLICGILDEHAGYRPVAMTWVNGEFHVLMEREQPKQEEQEKKGQPWTKKNQRRW